MRNSHARLVISLYEVFVTWLWKLQKKNIEKFKKTRYSCYMWIEVDSSLVRFFSENPKLHLWCLSREFDSRFSQEPTKIRSLGQVCVRCAFCHIFMCFEKLLWNEFHGKVIREDAKLKKSIPVLLFIAHHIWIVRKGSVTFKAAGSVFLYFLCFSRGIT